MIKKASLLLISLVLSGLLAFAQEPYKLPPQEVVDILDAPPTPEVDLSPTGEMMLLADYEPMPSIAYQAQPLLRLAGIRIIPANNGSQRTTFYTGVSVKDLKDGSTGGISLPAGARTSFPQWSFDGRRLAFTRYSDAGVELWVADARSGETRALIPPSVNTVFGSGFAWMPDGRRLLVNMVPEGRGGPPRAPSVPVGPRIQETSGKFSKVWTYQDLLQDPYDESLFDYYAASQMVEIDVSSGEMRKIGAPGIYVSAEPSPDGRFILVFRLKKPYSYNVPYYYFSRSLEVWDRDGKLVRLLADLPMADEVPPRGVPTGVRNLEWRPLKQATLVWVEALDGGDPEKEVPHRDKLMTLSAPFDGEAREVARMEHRYDGIGWLEAEGRALLSEYDWKRRWRTTHLLNVDDPAVKAAKIFDLSVNDHYSNPGSPVSRTTERGERVVILEKDRIYLRGSGGSPEGDLPFLDRMDLSTLKKERLFRSEKAKYESFVGFIGKSRSEVVIRSESRSEPPNFYRLKLNNGDRKALTDFKDPAPQLAGMRKQLVRYKRDDGLPLSGMLYLPPGYKEGTRLPCVLWAYPLEYNDPSTAGQVRGSPHHFTFLRGSSQLFFVTQGYAVLDGAQMPVVGDPKTMNDTFIEQIVSSARAAIEALDSLGVIDPERVGVGGHSYGAFMTANLLAHSDLFAAGIARSGAFNRTLTPFGFQNERRTLWEAPEIYFRVSPFMHAHKINEPILIIHGEMDDNSGTFPIQSERLYHAVKGHGATARLVMLPHESHGYQARESILHVLAEMFEWFDRYVKNRTNPDFN